MVDVDEHLVQEQEIGDIVFNTDTTAIFASSRSIKNDGYIDKPDIKKYIFNNNLDTKLYYKENGIVFPIRHQPKLHLNSTNGNGVHIVTYYTIYKDNFDSINDIARYHILYNNEKDIKVREKIVDILKSNNKPRVNNITLRFITFIPEATIIADGMVTVNNISILKDIHKKYTGDVQQGKQKISNVFKNSLHIEIEYNDNTSEEYYFKVGDDFIKIKKSGMTKDVLFTNAFIDERPVKIGAIPINKDNRNIYGLYTKSDIEKDEDINDKKNKILDSIFDTTRKQYNLVEDIKSILVNDEQAKLELQKAIHKLTVSINKADIDRSIKDYKDMLKSDKDNSVILADMLKIFKAIS